jgi:hypothetical protein
MEPRSHLIAKETVRLYSFQFSMGKDTPDTVRGTRETTMFTENMQIHRYTQSPCNETNHRKNKTRPA